MYDFLSGRIAERGVDEVVVEVGGIGYRLRISASTAATLGGDEQVTLFTEHMIRDERAVLYGFASKPERSLFGALMSVSKVGPSIAMALLSAMEAPDVVAALEARDVKALSKVKGVGKRTAERLCVELGDRVDTIVPASFRATVGEDRIPTPTPGGLAASVASALLGLGYPKAMADLAAERVCAKAGDDDDVSQLVKEALAVVSGAGSAEG